MTCDPRLRALRGYTLPLSPSGRSSLVSPPPWHFSGEVLLVEYLTEPEAVKSFLGSGLDPRGEPGLVAAVFGDWQSCTEGCEELLDPVRSQYREFYIVFPASWQGKPVARCPYCWVDKDFSLVRGLIQGFPKRLGRIAMTRSFGLGKASPLIGPGAQFAGSMASEDRRRVYAKVCLEAQTEPPSLMLAPLVHSRTFPAWDPAERAIDELVTGGSSDQAIQDVWKGTAELEIFESPYDELASLRPVEVLQGYRFKFAETITPGKLLSSTGR